LLLLVLDLVRLLLLLPGLLLLTCFVALKAEVVLDLVLWRTEIQQLIRTLLLGLLLLLLIEKFVLFILLLIILELEFELVIFELRLVILVAFLLQFVLLLLLLLLLLIQFLEPRVLAITTQRRRGQHSV